MIAASSIDDVFVITIFGMFLGMYGGQNMKSNGDDSFGLVCINVNIRT